MLFFPNITYQYFLFTETSTSQRGSHWGFHTLLMDFKLKEGRRSFLLHFVCRNQKSVPRFQPQGFEMILLLWANWTLLLKPPNELEDGGSVHKPGAPH